MHINETFGTCFLVNLPVAFGGNVWSILASTSTNNTHVVIMCQSLLMYNHILISLLELSEVTLIFNFRGKVTEFCKIAEIMVKKA